MEPNNDPAKEAEFSLYNFRDFYDKVFIKQEDGINEQEKEAEINNVSQFNKVDEIKIEDSEYLNIEGNIQQKLFNSTGINDKMSLDHLEPRKIHDKFLVLNGPNNERRYGCQICEFNTKHKVSLYRHVKLHNPKKMQSYKCDICGFETVYRRHLDVHVKVLHGKESTNKLYKCDQCSYACNYRENLSRHKKTHLAPEDRNSFICELCGFQTFYRKSYWVHMEMIHPLANPLKQEEAEFKCYHCPFETKYRVNIVRHLKTHMKGDTPIYKCSDCDFQTIHKTNFNTHVLRHKDPSKIKIFECQHCSHKTFYKASLRNHLKLHMKKEEIETYKCDICDFATIYERSLKLHVLYMHNGDHQAIEYFKCHFCDFETRYRENWRRHEKGHSKPGKQDNYNCAECSFSTIQQGRYERHLLVHASPEQLATLGEPSKRSEGKKRFRAVIDTPATYLASTETQDNGELVGGILDNFKAQTFTDGKSEELTMFQCCHCSYKTLNKQLLDEHLSTHHVEVNKSQIITDISEAGNGCESFSEDVRDTVKMDSDKINSSIGIIRNGLHAQNGKKLYNCQRCPFTTIHRSSIRRHRETHLRPSERKEYRCPTCIFRSYTRARVNSHECPNRNKNIAEIG